MDSTKTLLLNKTPQHADSRHFPPTVTDACLSQSKTNHPLIMEESASPSQSLFMWVHPQKRNNLIQHSPNERRILKSDLGTPWGVSGLLNQRLSHTGFLFKKDRYSEYPRLPHS